MEMVCSRVPRNSIATCLLSLGKPAADWRSYGIDCAGDVLDRVRRIRMAEAWWGARNGHGCLLSCVVHFSRLKPILSDRRWSQIDSFHAACGFDNGARGERYNISPISSLFAAPTTACGAVRSRNDNAIAEDPVVGDRHERPVHSPRSIGGPRAMSLESRWSDAGCLTLSCTT
jgi:hypothetical protein